MILNSANLQLYKLFSVANVFLPTLQLLNYLSSRRMDCFEFLYRQLIGDCSRDIFIVSIDRILGESSCFFVRSLPVSKAAAIESRVPAKVSRPFPFRHIALRRNQSTAKSGQAGSKRPPINVIS